tara:strand:+ start:50 stop:235 length:186 start_codon:yes stop_codon:yes gene_type:complete
VEVEVVLITLLLVRMADLAVVEETINQVVLEQEVKDILVLMHKVMVMEVAVVLVVLLPQVL